jgi:hypothetical protein
MSSGSTERHPVNARPGPQGPAGAQGPAGPSSMSGITVATNGVTVAPGDVDGVVIPCPSGQRVVSGGYFSASADGEVFMSVASDDRTAWLVALDNFDSPVEGDIDGEAYCADAGQAVAARRHDTRSAKRQLARLVARREVARQR